MNRLVGGPNQTNFYSIICYSENDIVCNPQPVEATAVGHSEDTLPVVRGGGDKDVLVQRRSRSLGGGLRGAPASTAAHQLAPPAVATHRPILPTHGLIVMLKNVKNTCY